MNEFHVGAGSVSFVGKYCLDTALQSKVELSRSEILIKICDKWSDHYIANASACN